MGSAERGPLQAVSEVTEGALAGEPGRVRRRGIPDSGLGQKGPQRASDPIPSFYQWEDQDAPGKGLIQSHPGRPSQLPGSSKQPAGCAPIPPTASLSPCGVPLAGACACQEPPFPFSGCRRPAWRWGH